MQNEELQAKIIELETKLEGALNIIERRKKSDANRTALRKDMEAALQKLFDVDTKPVFDQTEFNTAARGVLEVYCRLTEIEMPRRSALNSSANNLILDVGYSRILNG